MELSSKQQIFEAIKKSKKIMLATKQFPSEDSVSSLIALGLFLEKSGKEVDMITAGPVPLALSFLPGSDRIGNEIKSKNNFLISLDTTESEVAQFSYDFDKDNKKLNIYITPREGAYSTDNLTAKMIGFGYDAIMILNSSDFENLGSLYTKNTDIFYETPIINIDHSSANENYGEINMISSTASTTSEIVYEILESFDSRAIDKRIATCLLTGIIAGTKSFQNPNATPQSFTAAAKLIASGADQQAVINNLYKNKSLSTLKLWGRVLARVKHNPENRIAWSLISQKDFINSGAKSQDLEGITDEIMSSVSKADIAFVIYESLEKRETKEQSGKKIGIIIKTLKEKNLEELSKIFNISPRENLMKVKVNGGNLIDVEKDILKKIKNITN